MKRRVMYLTVALLTCASTSVAEDTLPGVLGTSFSMTRNTPSCLVFDDQDGRSVGSPSVAFRASVLDSQVDVAKAMSIETQTMARAKVPLLSVKGDLETAFSISHATSERDVSWVISVSAEYPNLKIDASKGVSVGDAWKKYVTVPPKPTPRWFWSKKRREQEAAKWETTVEANWLQFKDSCGEYYVDSIERSANVHLQFVWTFEDVKKATDLRLRLQGELEAGPVSAQQLTNIAASYTKNTTGAVMSLDVRVEGVSGDRAAEITDKLRDVDVLKTGNYRGLLDVASTSLRALDANDAVVSDITAVPIQSLFPDVAQAVQLPDTNDLRVQERGVQEMFEAEVQCDDTIRQLDMALRYPEPFGLDDATSYAAASSELSRLRSALMELDQLRVQCARSASHKAIMANCAIRSARVADAVNAAGVTVVIPSLDYERIIRAEDVALALDGTRWVLQTPKLAPLPVKSITAALNTGYTITLSETLDTHNAYRAEAALAPDMRPMTPAERDWLINAQDHLGYPAEYVPGLKQAVRNRYNHSHAVHNRYVGEKTATHFDATITLENGFVFRLKNIAIRAPSS